MRKEFLLLAILTGFLLNFSKTLLAQTDTEFWFVAPRATNYHEGDYLIKLKISSFGQASTVTLSIPQNEPPGWPMTLAIAADSMVSIDLTSVKSYLENWPFDQVLKAGLHITATNPVTAYYEIGQIQNGEIFSLKGINALGTEFFTPATLAYHNDNPDITWYQHDAWSGIDIVATEDNTTVTIVLANAAAKNNTSIIKVNSYDIWGGCCQPPDAWTNCNWWTKLYSVIDTSISTDGGSTFTIKNSNTVYTKTNSDCPTGYTPQPNNKQNIIETTLPTTPYNAGETITIILNKGETYNVRAYSKAEGQHLGGTKITSDKPIAVTVNEDTDNIDVCQDIIGDQIVPVNIVGEEYIAVVGETLNSEDIVLVGTQDTTTVAYYDINGTPSSLTLNEGEVKEIKITGSGANTGKSIYMKADKPIYVYQVTGIETCEAGSALLPPIICTGSRQVAFSRTQVGSFAMVLLTKATNKAGFSYTIEGKPAVAIPASNFNPVIGTNNEWVSARVSFANREIPINTQCVVTNSIGIFHLGISNGFPVSSNGNGSTLCTTTNGQADTCVWTPKWSGTGTYGYFSNFGVAQSHTSTDNQLRYASCEVKMGIKPGFLWRKWLDINMIVKDTVNDTITFPVPKIGSDTTVYSIRPNDDCGGIDTIKYIIKPTKPIAGFSKDLCGTGSDSVKLGFDPVLCLIPSATFKWFSTDSTVSTDTTTKVLKSGIYKVYFYDGVCLADSGMYNVVIKPKPIPKAPIDTTVCLGSGTITLDAGVNLNMHYKWSTLLATDTNQTLVVNPSPAYTQTYYYTVTITNECIVDTFATSKVIVLVPDVKTNTETLYTGCSLTLNAPASKIDYHWSTNPITDTTDTKILSITDTTTLKVWYYTDTTYKCKPDTSIFVVYPFMPDTYYSADLCLGKSVTVYVKDFVPKSEYDSLEWVDVINGVGVKVSDADSMFFDKSDTLWLVLHYKGCTSDFFPFKVRIAQDPPAPNLTDTVACPNDLITIKLNDDGRTDLTYLWSTGNTTTSFTVPTSSGGEYYYTVTVTNTCAISKVETMKVTVLEPVVKPNTDLYYTACQITLQAPDGYNDYHWSDNSTTSTIHMVLNKDQVVKVWYNENKCGAFDTTIFNLTPILPEAGKTDSLCVGGSKLLDVSDQKFDSLAWFNGKSTTSFSDSSKISIAKTGIYNVVFYYRGCVSPSYTFNLTIVPDPKVIITNVSPICIDNALNKTVVLNAVITPENLKYKWSTGDTSSLSITVSEAKTYTITATNICQVISVAQANVVECPIVVPDVFTPNGDGINEIFWIKDVEKSVWQVYIYNRWGNLVYKSDHYQNTPSDGWDGGTCSDGVYFWVVTNAITGERYTSETTKNGTGYVHLIRDKK